MNPLLTQWQQHRQELRRNQLLERLRVKEALLDRARIGIENATVEALGFHWYDDGINDEQRRAWYQAHAQTKKRNLHYWELVAKVIALKQEIEHLGGETRCVVANGSVTFFDEIPGYRHHRKQPQQRPQQQPQQRWLIFTVHIATRTGKRTMRGRSGTRARASGDDGGDGAGDSDPDGHLINSAFAAWQRRVLAHVLCAASAFLLFWWGGGVRA